MKLQLTAVFQKALEGYIGFVKELPGRQHRGEYAGGGRVNLLEAVALVLKANRALAQEAVQGKDIIRESLPLSPA